jgi:hypothetical protein
MSEMPTKRDRNEAIWHGWSASWVKAALTWPREKQIRFTRDERFRNLTSQAQSRIWKSIEANRPSPAAGPVPPARRPARLRIPTAIAPATRPTSPRRSWVKGEFGSAVRRASISWLAVLVGALIVLKLFAGG